MFLLLGQLSVVAVILVSVSPPCYCNSTVKDPGHSARKKCVCQVTAKHIGRLCV